MEGLLLLHGMEISCPSLPCARRLWQRPLAWGFSAWESHSSPCHGGLAGSPYLIDVQGHKLSGTIVAVGTIFMKLTLLGSYSFERQSAAAEPFSSPAPWSPMGRLLGLQLSGYVLEHVLGSRFGLVIPQSVTGPRESTMLDTSPCLWSSLYQSWGYK